MSSALHGHGSTLILGAGGGTNTTAITEIISINGPSASKDPIDVSNFGSSAKWKEFIPGMIDAGEISLTVNYTETDANNLEGWLTAATDKITLTFPGNDTFTATGFVTSLGTSIETEDKVTQEVTIKLTGALTYTTV